MILSKSLVYAWLLSQAWIRKTLIALLKSFSLHALDLIQEKYIVEHVWKLVHDAVLTINPR